MRSRDIWVLVAVLVLAGVALLSVAGQRDSSLLRVLALALIVVPVGLTANVTARRRRQERREDAPDSVERQAAQRAAAQAFRAVIVVNGLLMLALVLVPGPLPGLWGIGAFAAVPVLFWACYAVELSRLRG